jgi:hypothetical protein
VVGAAVLACAALAPVVGVTALAGGVVGLGAAAAVAGAPAAVGAAATCVGVAGAGAQPLASSASAIIAAPKARGINTTSPPPRPKRSRLQY